MLGCTEDPRALRAVEIYSGIGGMHLGTQLGAPRVTVVGALEVHNIANDVYEHNFGWRPTQINLEGISPGALDKYQADIWLMSPPCQPFTRRGLQLHNADPRSASFLHLLQLLPALKHPPRFMLVENVVGFEASPMRAVLHNAMAAISLDMQEFLVTPLQLGVPYSRPRYYALGRRRHADGTCSFPLPALPTEKPHPGPPGPLVKMQSVGRLPKSQLSPDATEGTAAILPISHFLDERAQSGSAQLRHQGYEAPERKEGASLSGRHSEGHHQSSAGRSGQEGTPLAASQRASSSRHRANTDFSESLLVKKLQDAQLHSQSSTDGSPQQRPHEAAAPDDSASAGHQQAQGQSQQHSLAVPENVTEQWGQSLDIVGPDSRRCNCFTKTYFRWVKGSGSVLATRNTELVRQRGSMHAWDLSGEGGIHEHSQFLHLKLRSAARLGASTAGIANGIDRHGAGEQRHDCNQVEDAFAEPLSCEDKFQQHEDHPSLPKEHASSEGRPTHPNEHARLSTEELKSLRLRYFSPREIARLHSFPETFSFPQHVTLRQQYALLGNSVSALVIADLLKYLLRDTA